MEIFPREPLGRNCCVCGSDSDGSLFGFLLDLLHQGYEGKEIYFACINFLKEFIESKLCFTKAEIEARGTDEKGCADESVRDGEKELQKKGNTCTTNGSLSKESHRKNKDMMSMAWRWMETGLEAQQGRETRLTGFLRQFCTVFVKCMHRVCSLTHQKCNYTLK